MFVKIEFDDESQENYLKQDPARTKHYEGPEKEMKKLEFLDKAASAISDGDIVDAMIHSCVSSLPSEVEIENFFY